MWKVVTISLDVPSRPLRNKTTEGLRPIKAVFVPCWNAVDVLSV